MDEVLQLGKVAKDVLGACIFLASSTDPISQNCTKALQSPLWKVPCGMLAPPAPSDPPVPGVARQPLPVGDQAVQKHALVFRVRDAGRRALLAEERAVLVDVGEVRRVAACSSCAHVSFTATASGAAGYTCAPLH